MNRSARRRWSKVGLLVLLSVVGGALCGATAGVPFPVGAEFGAVFGAANGLLFSAVLVWCLLDKPVVPGVVMIFVPAWIAALVLAGRPGWAYLASTATCMVVAVAARRHLPEDRRDRESDGLPRCRDCDYDLIGNTTGVCPECGTSAVEKSGA